MEAESVFNSCDKGQEGHLAKVLSWFSKRDTNQVRKFILDIEKCSGYSLGTALAIKNSTKKLVLGPDFRYGGGGTDAGGGGTGFSLKKAMIHYKIAGLDALVSYCCIHGIQLVFKEGISNWLREGGLEQRTAMQLLHSFYDLQKCLWSLPKLFTPD